MLPCPALIFLTCGWPHSLAVVYRCRQLQSVRHSEVYLLSQKGESLTCSCITKGIWLQAGTWGSSGCSPATLAPDPGNLNLSLQPFAESGPQITNCKEQCTRPSGRFLHCFPHSQSCVPGALWPQGWQGPCWIYRQPPSQGSMVTSWFSCSLWKCCVSLWPTDKVKQMTRGWIKYSHKTETLRGWGPWSEYRMVSSLSFPKYLPLSIGGWEHEWGMWAHRGRK